MNNSTKPVSRISRRILLAGIIVFMLAPDVRLAILGQESIPQQSTSGPFPPASAMAKEPLPEILALEAVTNTITGVPGYAWRHGCGPTAVGMLLGYYATHGFPDLFAGDASMQTESVNQGIASQGSGVRGSGLQLHYEDYALPMDSGQSSVFPDSSAACPASCRVSNSVADYMHTSWSSDSNFYGWSWSSKIATSFTSYVTQQNPQYAPQVTQYYMSSNLTWAVLTNEIDNNRPMIFLVDSNGDGKTDHFVTVVAYTDTPTLQYGCLDTWYPYDQIRWCDFKSMSSTYAWGVWGGWAFGLSNGSCPAPGAPSAASPANGATLISTAPTLNWTAGADTNSYYVYFGTSPTPPLAGNTTSTSYQLSGLSNSTKYYWQVVAKNTCGNSTAGSIWSFTTAAAPAPVISGVSSSSITGSGATISWKTDLASDSQVEYGATTSYGNSATLDASLVTSHSQALTALASGTAYHYRVKSRSAAGALATSGDYTFATPDASPPVISAISASSLTGTSAAISWTTNETSDSQVEYGTTTSYGRLTTLDSAKVISHSQSLSGLSGSTTYHYRVKSQDAAGNLATSGDYTFATLDVTAPTISSVAASGIAATSATIAWTTNEASDSQVEYGTTTSYGGSTTLNASMVTSHSQALAGLASGTTYHYRIKSRDAFGNLATSGDFTFTTLDVTAPTISAVSATGITATGATITWTTNEASDSQVEYGVSALYGNSVALDTARTTAHSQSLGGLSSATTYHYRVKSRDAAGNLAVSGDYAFTTLEDAGTPPVISGLAISKVTSRGATVTWTTDVPADTQVFYGTTAACSSSTKIKTALTTSHTQSLSGLKANTTYYFRVQSADARRNLAVSEIFTFSTTTGKEIRLVYPLVQGQQAGSATSGDGSQPDSSEFVGIAIANLSGADAVLRFTTHDRAGAEITGPDIVNPAERILAPGEQLALVDLQIFGRGLPNRQNLGWIDIDSNVQELGTFALIFNASLSMMEGMIAPDASLTQFVFSEIEDRGFTNLHVANPSEDPANITFQLLGAGGELRTSAQRTINPLGSIAESVTTLFPDISLDASDSIRVHSDTGVIPFELFGQKTHDVAALNGHDTYAGATKLYAPQYVVGGSYRSTLSVTNLEATDGRLTIQMFDDNGRQIGASRSIPIAAFGKVYISDPDFFNYYGQEMVEGYVQIKSNGPTLAGSVTFTDAFRESFATALPLVRSLEESMVFSHVATDSTYFMGLSLLNPEPTAAEATIELHRADGSIEATTSVTISPRHRLCSLVTEIFPELEGQSRTSGFIRVKSNGGVAAYSVFGTRDLRSLSAVPAQIVR